MRLFQHLIMVMSALLLASCLSKPATPASDIQPLVTLKTTPVKHQGQSPLCWAYAMLATIETDRLQQGDSVNLSPDYIGTRFLEEQAAFYYLSATRTPVSMRGTGTTTLNVMDRYGIVPYDSYHATTNISYNVLARKAMGVAHTSPSLKAMTMRLRNIIEQTVQFYPQRVYMLGATYTPKAFAHSVALPRQYIALSSYAHHPFGTMVMPELKDNYYRDSCLNITVDQLAHIVVTAIKAGHAVCWQGDISNPGFRFDRGTADVPPGAHHASQALRQRMIETKHTTDDHAMELCGIGKSRDGRLWILAKNSWGNNNPFGGFMYLSLDYIRLKTTMIVVDRNVLSNAAHHKTDKK